MILSPSLDSWNHISRSVACTLCLVVLVSLAGCQRNQNVPIKATVATPEFEEAVLQSDQLVLVDFAAEWCGPCHMMEPTLRELAATYEGRVRIETVDIEESPELVSAYKIGSLPTLVFFHGGEEVGRVEGVYSYAEMSDLLDGHLADAAQPDA